MIESLVTRFGGEWRGPYGDLLAAINSELDGDDQKPKARPSGWPKAPNKLSTALKRIAPNLRAIGYAVVEDTIGRGKMKIVTISAGQQEQDGSLSTASTASPANRTGAIENADRAGDTRVIDGASPEIDDPQENRVSGLETAFAGHAGHAGDKIRLNSAVLPTAWDFERMEWIVPQ